MQNFIHISKKNVLILSVPCIVLVLSVVALALNHPVVSTSTNKVAVKQDSLSSKINIKTLDTSILAITNEINNLNSSLTDKPVYSNVLGISVSSHDGDGISNTPPSNSPEPTHNQLPTSTLPTPTHLENHNDGGKPNSTPSNKPSDPQNHSGNSSGSTNPNEDHSKTPTKSITITPHTEDNNSNVADDPSELEKEAHPSSNTPSPTIDKNTSVRTQLNMEIDRRIAKLLELKNKILKSNSLTDQQKQAIIASIDAQSQNAQQSKSEIGVATDKNISTVEKKIDTSHVEFANVLPKAQSLVVEDRLNDAAVRINSVHDLLHTELNNSKIDQSTKATINFQIDNINTVAEKIKKLSSDAKILSDNLSKSTNVKQDIKPIQQLIAEALTNIQEDKNNISNVVNTISIDEANLQ